MKLILKVAQVLVIASVASAGPLGLEEFSERARVVDFDDLEGGPCNGCGPSVTDQYELWGVVFANPSYPGDVTAQTNLTHGVPNGSVNALWVYQGGLLADVPAAPLQILFGAGVNRVGFNFASSDNSFLLMEAYNGTQLVDVLIFMGSPTSIGWGGFAGMQSDMAITRLDVSYRPFSDPDRTLNFSIDNLTLETVPEPSSLISAGLGLLAIAITNRRRRA